MSSVFEIPCKLDPGAKRPAKAHRTDAGFDLCAIGGCLIPADGSAIFDTGVHMAIPVGYVGLVCGRSGLHMRHGLITSGVIDSGYRGPISVAIENLSGRDYHVMPGDRIAQLLIIPCLSAQPMCAMVEVEELPESTDGRGVAGIGSTGK